MATLRLVREKDGTFARLVIAETGEQVWGVSDVTLYAEPGTFPELNITLSGFEVGVENIMHPSAKTESTDG